MGKIECNWVLENLLYIWSEYAENINNNKENEENAKLYVLI